MAQPVEYARQKDFTAYQTDTPFDPIKGVDLDAELDAVKVTSDQVRTNLALLQRDDGEVQNRVIGREQLKSDALTEFGLLTATRTNEYIFDISSGGVDTVSGADRNGNTLAYVAAAAGVIGSHINMYVGTTGGGQSLEDPTNVTNTTGTSVVRSSNFPNPSVVVIHVGEAEFVPTTDIEKLDDISSSFNGILTVFPMAVGSQPRIANSAPRLDVYLDGVIQEPDVDFTVSGSNITFIVPPATGAVFWSTLRTLVAFGVGSLVTSYYSALSITGPKIAAGTITEDKLAFNISDTPVGGGFDWYHTVLPASAPTGTLVFPIGQTCGNCGSGADIEDDDIVEFYDLMKANWGNLGTEDFDSGDVVLLPDVRGTSMLVPDKSKGNIATNNTVGAQSGLEFLPNRSLVGSATGSGIVDPHTLTSGEQGSITMVSTRVSDSTSGGDATFNVSTMNGAEWFSRAQIPSSNRTTVIPAAGAAQGHAHVLSNVVINTTSLLTATDRVMHPYTVCEKILRIK